MRSGLRLQILFLLGGLLTLAFIPLHFAIAAFSGITVQRLREQSAEAIGRTVAARVGEARDHRTSRELETRLAAAVAPESIAAIGLYDARGQPSLRAGSTESAASLPAAVDPRRVTVLGVTTAQGRATVVVVPEPPGAVATLIRSDAAVPPQAALVRAIALYMAVVALALLVAAYFALTRRIVQPLDAIANAAERVANGIRRFEVPTRGPRELVRLGYSLRTMTERLLANEDALRRKVDELSAATRELERAQGRLIRSERLASVGRLAAGLAHEVGNPIAAMLGLLELLGSGDLSREEERDFVARLHRETERIHGILRDLLAFARPHTPRSDFPPAPGDVRVAIDEVVALVSPQPALRSVRLTVEVASPLPLVAMPRDALVQVLLNLILNAADACGPEGSVAVRAQLESRLRPTHGPEPLSAPTPPEVVVEIEDDGPGVDAAIRDRLFEPFVTTKEPGRGTGLGLAVCRGLVEAAGGTIALAPAVARGACFRVELPAQSDEPGVAMIPALGCTDHDLGPVRP